MKRAAKGGVREQRREGEKRGEEKRKGRRKESKCILFPDEAHI